MVQLNKYQFFVSGEVDGTNFTFLDMQAKGFQVNKDALLSQGLFVDGEIILAKSSEEAVAKYKQGYAKVVRGGNSGMHQFYTFFSMLGERLRKNK
ncbi:hypothetical protein VHA01S_009_00110 [Vibrio halioticoli NBRC 102217]|uniref:Uncharacterized protein n=1 Tax=Vibrio halioticoli NBRC 102217 TaxID=1219072 RepID=V5F0S0_9VIBR|nr:hypothetical protein [Vibrio halioticoli]GAD88724.1 hypothetical protein VHA01S_009_00110 [Vibrio halioticoli NBRC 102217]